MKIEEAKSILSRYYAVSGDWQRFKDAATIIAKEMHAISIQHAGRITEVTSVYTSVDNVTVCLEGFSCGETDYYEYTFPLVWFEDENWIEKYRIQLEKEKEKRVEVARLASEEKEKKDKELRFAMFQKLEKEFSEKNANK